MIEFEYIDTQEKLSQMCRELAQFKTIAVDLECENSLHHYGVYVALIQISTTEKNYIIDVLALNDLKPLCAIFNNSSIQKIFHDVSFDFRILQDQFKCIPKNIFDTQLAALFLGKQQLGLGSLLEEYFNIQKERKYQRVDWTKRPLTKDMLSYAVKDTAYLLQLKEQLEKEIKEKKREAWILQENKHLEKQQWQLTRQTYIDVKGAKSLEPRQRTLLKLLFAKREEFAKKADKPVFKIFSTKQLMCFVQNPPYNEKSWSTLKGVHPMVKRKAREMAQVVAKAKKLPGECYERQMGARFTPKQRSMVDAITQLRNDVMNKQGLAPHLLASVCDIRTIVATKSSVHLRKWQRELFGPKLVALIDRM